MRPETASQVPAAAPCAGEPAPVIVNTRRGPVEYPALGEGPAILALHGAMGGYDQGLILARTIGEPGYRYIAVSRPGYLGTPLSGERTPEEQVDLFTHRDAVRARVTRFLCEHAPRG